MASLLDSIFSARFVMGGVEYVQRKTIEFIGAAVSIVDDPVNERTKITIESSATALPHAATHEHGGGDALTGDLLRVDYVPTNYARMTGSVPSVDQLTAHLNGIDVALLSLGYDYIDRIMTATRVNYLTVSGTSHSFDINDAYKTFLCTSTTAITLQIPTNLSVPYEIGTVFSFVPMSTGQITLSGASGVVLLSGNDEKKSARQYGPMFVQQTAVNVWLVSGEKAA